MHRRAAYVLLVVILAPSAAFGLGPPSANLLRQARAAESASSAAPEAQKVSGSDTWEFPPGDFKAPPPAPPVPPSHKHVDDYRGPGGTGGCPQQAEVWVLASHLDLSELLLADLDCDGVYEPSDLAGLQIALAGPGLPTGGAASCKPTDHDGDADTDLFDAAVLQQIGGPPVPVRLDYRVDAGAWTPLYGDADVTAGGPSTKFNWLGGTAALNFRARAAFPAFAGAWHTSNSASDDPARSIVLVQGSNLYTELAARGAQPAYFGQPALTTILANWLDAQTGQITLPADERLILLELGPTAPGGPAFDFQDAVLRVVSTCRTDVDVAVATATAPSYFGVSRLGSVYNGVSTRVGLAYTEIDATTNPGAPVEKVQVALFDSFATITAGATPSTLRTRPRSDPNARDIRAIELAIGPNSFHAVAWVEVTSTSATEASGPGESTLFESYVCFTTNNGATWTAPEQIASFRYDGLGRNFAGDIDVAFSDAGVIGVLVPFDRAAPASQWLLRGSPTSVALALVEYTPATLNAPTIATTVTGSIDYPAAPGVQNVVDMTSGYSGVFTTVTGGWNWVERNPPDHVLHLYYAQGGLTRVFYWGMAGSAFTGSSPGASALRTIPAPNTGYPYATNTRRNALFKITGYIVENPPIAQGNGNLYPLTNAAFGPPAGNRLSDTVFTTEAPGLATDPKRIEAHLLNSAGVIHGAYIMDTPTLPHRDDVTSGPCYFYPAQQYAAEDRGAVAAERYLSTSIRTLGVETAGVLTETGAEVVVHRGDDYRPDFASVIGFDRLGPVYNSTNHTSMVASMDDQNYSWDIAGSVWTAPQTGTLATVRAAFSSYQSDANKCGLAPGLSALNWRISLWPSVASFSAQPRSAPYSVTLADPTNSMYYVQYASFTPGGCTTPQSVIDVRFDITNLGMPVAAGQEVVVAVVAVGTYELGRWFEVCSAIPPAVSDLWCGNVTGGVPVLISPFVQFPRFGGIVTIIPNDP